MGDEMSEDDKTAAAIAYAKSVCKQMAELQAEHAYLTKVMFAGGIMSRHAMSLRIAKLEAALKKINHGLDLCEIDLVIEEALKP
jgi:hypothetical protein